MRTLRTPDDRFTELPDFDHLSDYVEVADLDGGSPRLAQVAFGPVRGPADGPVVLPPHGKSTCPSRSHELIPVLAGAGFRAVGADRVGFGRSDKPAALCERRYARHGLWVYSLDVPRVWWQFRRAASAEFVGGR